jgi:hypothetical protein
MAKNIVLAVLAAAVVAGGVYYFAVVRRPPAMVDDGIPHYPGSKDINADKFAARLSPRDRARLIKVVILETDDPPDKVIQFYRDNLKGKTQVFEKKNRGVASGVFRTEVNGTGKLIVVTANEDTRKTEISIGEISNQMPKP